MDVVHCRGELRVVRHGCICVVITLTRASRRALGCIASLWLAAAEGAEEAGADDVFAAPGGEGSETSEEALLGTDIVTLLLIGATAVATRRVVIVGGILAGKET